jgi:signal transduction histidine kinase
MHFHPSASSDGDPMAKIESAESRRERFMSSIKLLQKELHDGLSQQVVGVAMMARYLADNLKIAGSSQAGKAEELAAAMEDTKRQTFAIAERLKQIESDLNR